MGVRGDFSTIEWTGSWTPSLKKKWPRSEIDCGWSDGGSQKYGGGNNPAGSRKERGKSQGEENKFGDTHQGNGRGEGNDIHFPSITL